MKIRDNTVVAFSYRYSSPQKDIAGLDSQRTYRMQIIVGKEMLPRSLESFFYDREEGEEIDIPIYPPSCLDESVIFLSFDKIPQGIELKKGNRISIVGAGGISEIVLIEDILPDGIMGKPVHGSLERFLIMHVKIESVRWATLKEFQEGRVMGGSDHSGH